MAEGAGGRLHSGGETTVSVPLEATVELSVGNTLMLNNTMMLKMYGGAKPRLAFKLVGEGDVWKITGFNKKLK